MGNLIVFAFRPVINDEQTSEVTRFLIFFSANLFNMMLRFYFMILTVYVLANNGDEYFQQYEGHNAKIWNNEGNTAMETEVHRGPRMRRESRKRDIPACGATAVRLRLDLTKLYGRWYPVQASRLAYNLWITSLYGDTAKNQQFCPVWDILPGPPMSNSLKISLTHGIRKITVDSFLLQENADSKASKWITAWPNEEDTLTSVVAIGTRNGFAFEQYDWMLTVDCDLTRSISSDWAIFSRNTTISPEALMAIRAIASGVSGIRLSDVMYGTGCP